MSTKDDEFLKRLQTTFTVEAEEHLEAIASALLELEKTPAPELQRGIVETAFRAAHSLKGAARTVDFIKIESLCQSLEDMFASWKKQQSVRLSSTELDIAERTLDAITQALSAPQTQQPPPDAVSAAPSLDQAIPDQPLQRKQDGEQAFGPVTIEKRDRFFSDQTVRIAVAKLEARLIDAEEMLMAKLTTNQRAHDLRELGRGFESWRNEWAMIEPEARALHQTIARQGNGRSDIAAGPGWERVLKFFDLNLEQFKALDNKVAALIRTAQQDSHVVGKLVDDLLVNAKTLLLLPFATVVTPFPKLVRDLCRDQGKEADLVILGKDVEIDKRILEEMKDPLIHLLRNCIDHGIETPEVRLRLGKPARATITLAVSQIGDSKVQLHVADDGAGINVEMVKASAQKHGLLSADNAKLLDDAAAQALIFQAEVSTSPTVTRVSGRGLGLAIVREKTEKLGGTVTVESHPGLGSSFYMVLPSMLATFRGILIEAAQHLFIVPTFQVERVARIRADDIQTVEGRATISLGGRALALVRLDYVLALPVTENAHEPSAGTPVIILGIGEQRIAFAVDAVLDEQEVLVKPLRKPLSRVRNIAGATVLGSGQVAPILNVADLLLSARKAGGTAQRATAAVAAAQPQARMRSILVAEDSITSRMLLKGILEAAGYQVKTAVDGMDALALLHAEKFDLLVSDVEMPRLNGFELTAKIRADTKLAELPVVLVTAMEKLEDRERGIDVGAQAYLVKSSFDQSNLLEVVRRLI